MKYLVLAILPVLFFAGCSSSFDTSTMTADQRLEYAMSLFNEESYDLAIREFESILVQFPGSEVIDDAQFYLARSRFERKEFLIAASEYSRLIRTMPGSEFVPESQYLLAECYYRLSPHYSLDQRFTKKAIEELQAFIDFFPTDPRVNEAEKKISEMNEKLALKEFNSARIYEKMEYYTAAIDYYSKVIEVYHDTPYAPDASFRKINLLIERSRLKEALAEVNQFLVKYPEHKEYNSVMKLKESLEKQIQTAVN